jgi:HEAT repeat protein
MEGQGNPRLAQQGAKYLAAVAAPEDAEALMDAFRQGDPLIQRLALRILGSMAAPGIVPFLLETAEQVRESFLDLQLLMDLLNRLQTMPRASTRPELLRQIAGQFSDTAPQAVAALQQAATREEGDLLSPLGSLRPSASGAFQTFLLDALTLVAEGKVARYGALLSETTEGTEARLAGLVEVCDHLAETLAYKVDAGEATADQVLPVLAAIFRSRAGGDGFIQSFLRFLPATESGILAELRKDPDMARREKYLDALGAREDDAFAPFFMEAMGDPIVEVGQRAIHHLGKLPSSYPILMAQFQSGNVEEVRQAIWVFGENRTRAAAEPLLEFLQKENPDPLLVAAVEAIHAIGYPGSAPVLLELLHDGKPLNLQVALARALKDLGTPEASLGLLARASNLKQAQVLILALEGALTAFPAFDHPLALEHLPAFLALMDRCCDDREGEGQRLRAILATQDLYVFDRRTYEQLKDRFGDYLFDMRTKENWDRDSNDQVAAVIKELGRRSEALGQLAQKEAGIQGQVQRLPAAGPKRVEALLALRESLTDPGLILRPEICRSLGAVVKAQLQDPPAEWRETALLCEIGGISNQVDLTDPIREIFQRASGLGLKSAARSALLRLGVAEEDLNRRAPIHSVLLLEPSAFFRKRLATALATHGPWQLLEASSRQEAEAVLAQSRVDLVLTESQDPAGDLAPWLEDQWGRHAFRYALVSTANRGIGNLAQAPWVIGVLFKPYPMEQAIRALG